MDPSLYSFVNRFELLGLEFLPLLFLFADCFLILNISVYLLRQAGFESREAAETFLAGGLVFLGCIVLTATVLGGLGVLSWQTLFTLHILIWLGLPLVQQRRSYLQAHQDLLEGSRTYLRTMLSPLIGIFKAASWVRGKRLESVLTVTILMTLFCFAILAIFTLPLNYDSNTYRLSRIAYWLQERNIYHFMTNDLRQNFMAQNADLVMLWLTSFFRKGFPLVSLAQFFGGLLSSAAVYALSRALGFTRLWRLGAVITLLGMPNVATQFFTSQTDLFTAGCLAAGLVFLLRALNTYRQLDWSLFGTGLGLAVGAKGTVFYWGPGLLVLLLGWALMQRTPWQKVLKGIVVAAILALLLGGFNYAQNYISYGNPFAPVDLIEMAHSSFSTSRLHYGFLNSMAYIWQIFEPNSNVPALRPLTDRIFKRLQGFLLALQNPHFPAFPRRFQIATQWIQSGLSEDLASFGFPVFLLAVGGGLMSIALLIRSRHTETIGTVAIFISTVLFLAVFAFLQAWTVHKYRYFVLLAPFLSVLSMSALVNLCTKGQKIMLLLFLSSQAFMAGHVAVHSRHHGLLAMINPQAAANYAFWDECTSLMRKTGNKSLHIAIVLRPNSWLAPYFRSSSNHHFSPVLLSTLRQYGTAEAFLAANRYDLLITDPETVAGRLGRVRSYFSTKHSRMGVRLTDVNETPNPVILPITGLYSDGWTTLNTSLGAENWIDGTVVLNLKNPTPFLRRIIISSAIETKRLTLKPQQREAVTIRGNTVDTITLEVSPAFVPAEVSHQSPDRRALGVRLELPGK